MIKQKGFRLGMALLALLSLAGCTRPGEENISINSDQSQLYITNFDGGIGSEWLTPIKKAFEAKYQNTSFEEGKKGVQVLVSPVKQNGISLFSTFKGSSIDILFNEYVAYNSYVSNGYFLALDDLVGKANPEDGNKTIESKLRENEKTALKAYDGHYYALPHYEVYNGLTYDRDLFDEEKLYLAADPDNGNNGFISSSVEKKSVGPDGVYGTDDDGLPVSYEEFFALCDYMVQRGVTPFIWTGQYADDYTVNLVEPLANAYSGARETMYNYTFDSGEQKSEIVDSFNNAQPVVSQHSITPASGYLLQQQSGKYYGLDFLHRMLSKSDYYYAFSGSGNKTLSHIDAQEDYLMSKLENKPIAFLVDGSWWENEAVISGAVARMENTYKERGKNRHFSFMPLPYLISGHLEEGKGRKNVFSDFISSYAAINASIKKTKVELAKSFLAYCYSDEALRSFTATTGIAKGVDYAMDEASLAKLSPFSLSVWKMRENAEIIYPHSGSKLFVNNENAFHNNYWHSSVNGQLYERPFTAYKDGLTAQVYFQGMAIDEATWKKNYGKDF